ncbi:FAD-binding and (Fe-S)-binding domain-containing protein [Crenobacter sp. SG2303]|uniref:FAD-binding and (Fe-S)-binding domain-containing protein n=1 Tax=Crenobacter oryzisoli TaxID=3056844 RepID=A0ABT7XI33_9NEIS|nr:FAD-binding and (Fe-S)-binding domain-containing protein [Crenobacter sp. SG2303]MDN0073441.1 FAD-binding and (Fe-S)-binding domain-containing protein [Crenobacter sp. SG2303]
MIPRLTDRPVSDSLYHDFAAELRLRGFEGELSASYADRTVLSTDNSIYQVWPQLITFPKHADDLVRIAKLSGEPRFQSLKLAPRGGGTGTNGQSLSDGVIVDVSRHMNRILEINAEERWVRVESGVVKDQLNAALKPYGLFFAPELSTSNRATIGGMINTDASGQGSCLYGKTRDHVLELSTVLLDGTLWHSQPLVETELTAIKQRDDRVGSVHRLLDAIFRDDAALIAEKFPKLNRCLTGYDLAHIRDEQGRFNLNNILCGAEGTLGLVYEAKLNVLPIPRCSALVNVRYTSFDAALRDAPALMALNAASIETVDSKVLNLARQDIIWHGVREFFPDDAEPAQGINLVEFLADSEDDLERQLAVVADKLTVEGSANGRCGHTVARGAAAVNRIWGMRKKSVGLLGNLQGDKRPIPFVEDTAVPPENLADYIAEFRTLLDSHGVAYGMFGHVDAGVLHVRPVIDMKDPEQEKLVRAITDGVVALTQKYHGLLWGEHGKGVRSEYAPAFFGPLYSRLQDIKAAFDPHNQLNPGKIATPPGGELLKIDAVPTRGQHDRVIPISVRQGFDEGLHCNGNGACYNFDPDDAMCPSWKGTRERRHSPKGRASLLREWLRQLSLAGVDPLAESTRLRATGSLAGLFGRLRNTLAKRRGEADFSHEVMEAMQGCLACKSCVGQCPVKVDVPEFRAKFLELYYGRYLRPLKDYLIGSLESTLPLVAKLPGLYNAVLGSGAGRALMRRIGLVESPLLSGIDPVAELARRGFALATPARLQRLAEAERARAVIVVQDAFTSYFETELLLDLFELLRTLGFTPLLAPFAANGKPLHVHGFLGAFRKVAGSNAERLRTLAASGVPLVGLDPSMTLTYRAEYAKALGKDAAPKVQLLQEWLASRLADLPKRAVGMGSGYTLLPHCTEKTNAPAATGDWQKVFAALGLSLSNKNTGCCGMAGTFGHETDKRELSKTLYGMSWAKQVEADRGQGRLLATGYSCRCQVELIDGVKLAHPVQALLQELRSA